MVVIATLSSRSNLVADRVSISPGCLMTSIIRSSGL